MNSALDDEIVSINAIYDSNTLTAESGSRNTFVLRVPTKAISLRVIFPSNYPEQSPVIEGSESSGGAEIKKGKAHEVVEVARETLATCFRPGEPCIYDLLEELVSRLQPDSDEHQPEDLHEENTSVEAGHDSDKQVAQVHPPWVLSEPITEKKSVFLARAAAVSSVEEAQKFIAHLVTNDKKASKATHNISAWRLKGDSEDTVFQDSDDDGEAAAGGRLLHLLQVMNVWGVVVVVSRWYGGILLGPARFSIINSVARDALLRGHFDAPCAVEVRNRKAKS